MESVVDKNTDIGIFSDLKWLEQLINTRVHLYFKEEGVYNLKEELSPPQTLTYSNYHTVITNAQLSYEERLILIMAVASYVRPEIYDIFYTKNPVTGIMYSEFGGITNGDHRNFIPTFKTLAFLMNEKREFPDLSVYRFSSDLHFFWKMHILDLNHKNTDSFLDTPLRLTKKFRHNMLMNTSYKPEYSSDFPAKLITTNLGWEDLIIPPHIQEEVNEIRLWIENESSLNKDEHLTKWLKPGYRVLLYGPSGTGKTLTVSLIGNVTGRKVYRVDLSLIVSKYIGETEKNLAKVFNMAENNDWILFFDEADALFGKRTTTSNSNDRYANQEVAYLLQRIEDFPGVVILATNLQSNIDEAFSRRFQLMVPFSMPTYEERIILWNRIFAGQYSISDQKFVREISKTYELSGGMIINILRTATLRAINQGKKTMTPEHILYGIRREYEKINKTI